MMSQLSLGLSLASLSSWKTAFTKPMSRLSNKCCERNAQLEYTVEVYSLLRTGLHTAIWSSEAPFSQHSCRKLITSLCRHNSCSQYRFQQVPKNYSCYTPYRLRLFVGCAYLFKLTSYSIGHTQQQLNLKLYNEMNSSYITRTCFSYFSPYFFVF